MYVSVLCCVCLLDPRELGFWMVMSYHMGPENQNLGPFQEQEVFLTTEVFFQPHINKSQKNPKTLQKNRKDGRNENSKKTMNIV